MIGDFRHRIAVERKTQTPNSPNDGGFTETWSTLFECWAKLEGLSASQILQAEALQNRRTHKCTLRYDEGSRISGNDRVRLLAGNRVFAIKSPPLDRAERRRFVDLDLEEGAPT